MEEHCPQETVLEISSVVSMGQISEKSDSVVESDSPVVAIKKAPSDTEVPIAEVKVEPEEEGGNKGSLEEVKKVEAPSEEGDEVVEELELKPSIKGEEVKSDDAVKLTVDSGEGGEQTEESEALEEEDKVAAVEVKSETGATDEVKIISKTSSSDDVLEINNSYEDEDDVENVDEYEYGEETAGENEEVEPEVEPDDEEEEVEHIISSSEDESMQDSMDYSSESAPGKEAEPTEKYEISSDDEEEDEIDGEDELDEEDVDSDEPADSECDLMDIIVTGKSLPDKPLNQPSSSKSIQPSPFTTKFPTPPHRSRALLGIRPNYRIKMKRKCIKWLTKKKIKCIKMALEEKQKATKTEITSVKIERNENLKGNKPVSEEVVINLDETPPAETKPAVPVMSEVFPPLKMELEVEKLKEFESEPVNLMNGSATVAEKKPSNDDDIEVICEMEIQVGASKTTSETQEKSKDPKEIPLEKTSDDKDKEEVLFESVSISSNLADSIVKNDKVLDLKMETNGECKETTDMESDQVKEKVTDTTEKTPVTTKRPREADPDDDSEVKNPTKKLSTTLEENFPIHDKMLTDYIENTCRDDSDNEIDKHVNQIKLEIQALADLLKEKELEWNNILHLKKLKEEIYLRWVRKKQVLDIKRVKVGEINEHMDCTTASFDCSIGGGDQSTMVQNVTLPSANAKLLNALGYATSTPLVSVDNAQQGLNSGVTTGGLSLAQSILKNRANMKSADLAKEKTNAQRMHRLLVSRNILPKPSGAAAGSGFSSLGGGSGSSMPTAKSTPITSISNFTASSTHPIQLTANIGQNQNISQNISNSIHPIFSEYFNSAALAAQERVNEMLNGGGQGHNFKNNADHHNSPLMIGRQGIFKDVKSIIADYRQKHPEAVPRRGRRLKSGGLGGFSSASAEANSILSNALKGEGQMNSSDLNDLLMKFENSRNTSNDSQNSMTNASNSNNLNNGLVSFKDVLVQFAKISGQADRSTGLAATRSGTGGTNKTSAPSYLPQTKSPYPEVTLHPVATSTPSSTEPATGSLLHGILTKYSKSNSMLSSMPSAAENTAQNLFSQHYSSSFSPTLAKLLTAPERLASSNNSNPVQGSIDLVTRQTNPTSNDPGAGGGESSGFCFSKMGANHSSEITITPVVSAQSKHATNSSGRSLLAHQFKDSSANATKDRKRPDMDDEADDGYGRLVIDEGVDASMGIDEHRIAPHAIGQEFNENEVPFCQGCKKQEAQFVCAGCGNQWYCSRECQVTAWDDHSEYCTG